MLTFGLLSSLLLLLLLSWEGTLVYGAPYSNPITEINNASDLIEFANNVNEGSTYSGTTVVLWSDIVFDEESSGEFEPMGSDDSTYYFLGTFDGQGHTISGLTLNSSSQYTGLFGYSNDGATIKNVVLSESCSIQSSYESTSNGGAYVGGIIGYCASSNSPSLIENVVNKARVSFNGNVTGNTLLGGIAGFLSSRVTVKNCANYGSVTYSGTAQGYTSIGGISGSTTGGGSTIGSIQNSLNYGTIAYNSKVSSKDLYIGGIVGAGMGEHTIITNCLSAGRITTEKKASENNWIGNIMGYTVSARVNVTYSHWTSETNCSEGPVRWGSSIKDIVLTGTNSSRDDTKTLAFLNSQVESSEDEWSRWRILHMNGGEINGLEREVFIVTGNYTPTPSRENNTFLFWCKDTTCTAKYNTSEPDASDHLYAAWHMVTVKFISNGGDPAESSKVVEYNGTYGDLPAATREGYTFLGWYTGNTGGSIVDPVRNVVYPRDHNLYVRWKINNYTVNFDLGNGTTIERTFEFNSTIIFPEGDFTKEGYTFDGWNLSITIMPAENITIAAEWRINNYSATFDLGNGTTIEKTFEFNAKIIFPEGDFTREGYTFDGWNKEIIVMPAKNITIAAKWIKNTELVEIVFEKKDLKEDEIRDIIEKYVENTEYEIKVIEYNDEGEARIILKFRDVERARETIQKMGNDAETNYITRIGFLSAVSYSFSGAVYPPFFFVLFFSLN